MENNRIHGYNGEVLIDSVRVAGINKFTLNMKADRADVSAMGDAHKKYVQGHHDVQGTLEGFLDLSSSSPADGNAAFFVACAGNSVVTLKLIEDNDNASNYWSGGAVLDAQITVDQKGAVTFSGTFAAAGETDWARSGLAAA